MSLRADSLLTLLLAVALVTPASVAAAPAQPPETVVAVDQGSSANSGHTDGEFGFDTSLQPSSWYRTVQGSTIDPFAVGPSSLPLGSVPATLTTPPGHVTVGFTGPGSGSVMGSSFSGPDAARFAVSLDGCAGIVLTNGQTCTIDVVATPAAVGSISGTLEVDLGVGEGTRSVALTASGTDPVSITPPVTLPTIRPGETAKAVVTVSSLAAELLPVSSVSLVGTATDVFGITSSGCAAGVPASGSCAIEVTYAPPAATSIYVANSQSIGVQVTGPGLLGTRTSQVMGSNALPTLGATWTVKSALGHRWNFGNGLARAVNGTTVTLAQVTSSDRVGSKAVKDAGPTMPVYLNRSTNGGATWASSVRVNPAKQHGIWPAVSASGRNVAVAWASATKVIAFSKTAPRVLYVRVSGNSGNGSWGAIHRLTPSTGRIDHPSIAGSGALVVVGYTDSVTGSVKVAVSRDRGATWRSATLGTTSVAASWGKTGLVSVAASGTTIAVTWVSSLYGSTKLRISTNSGTSWAGATSFAGGLDRAGVAIAGGRVAIAWVNGNLNVRVRTAGTWGPTRLVPLGYGQDENGDMTSYSLYGPSIALYGTSGLATTVSGEHAYCGGCDQGDGSDLLWSESSTNGATWASADRVMGPDYTYLYQDDASLVWVSPTLRTVLVNGWGYADKTSLVWGATSGPAPALAPAVGPLAAGPVDLSRDGHPGAAGPSLPAGIRGAVGSRRLRPVTSRPGGVYHRTMYSDALSFLEDERDTFRSYEALDALSDEQLDVPVEAAGGWSGRDLMGHIVTWQEAALATAKELAVGEQSPTMERLEAQWDAGPEAGDQMNADALARFRAMPMDDVRALFRTTGGELRGYLTVVPESRWIKHAAHQEYFFGEMTEHYQEHEKELRAILEAVS